MRYRGHTIQPTRRTLVAEVECRDESDMFSIDTFPLSASEFNESV